MDSCLLKAYKNAVPMVGTLVGKQALTSASGPTPEMSLSIQKRKIANDEWISKSRKRRGQ